MTSRGSRFKFEIGEIVLCFEPDPTKARVLYYAKVLNTHAAKDRQSFPGYSIHFQGWNSSWDRIVEENFILKNDEMNRSLMKRLHDTARKMRNNRKRRKKIDDILKQAFQGKPSIMDSDSSSGEDEEEEEEMNTSNENPIETESEVGSRDEETEKSDDSEVETEEKQQEQIASGPVEINIPDILKDRLFDDYHEINKNNKLLKLPSEPNIIQLLEEFVMEYYANELYEVDNDKGRSGTRDSQRSRTDLSLPLCKEVVDGIRICFDFTLPVILLCGSEKEQYTKISKNFKHLSAKIKQESSKSPGLLSPRRKSSRLHSPLHSEPSPKIPRLSPKTIKPDIAEDCFQVEVIPRRMTRNSITELQSPEALISQDSEFRSKKSRGNRRISSASNPASQKSDLEQYEPCPKLLAHRVTPPPPLLIPSTMSSSVSSSLPNSAGAANGIDPLYHMGRNLTNGGTDGLASWHLLPPDVYSQIPPLPSVIYGANHLLRLFVKFPDLIGNMSMSASKVKILVKHLEMFLEYMAEKHDDIFKDICYMNS